MTNSAAGQDAIRFEILLSIAAEHEWPLAAPDRVMQATCEDRLAI
jgi:hypothetical protein